ncbi:hypothetical protein FGO68_gene10593 [Halteria grandinella]|uniref:Uncharacterized protein n=1 Tax=Halteria grandinella TaxID=5974 RepID=A0A8J8T5Z4_HALGN|nr:hypothetical protein FGO68_gene10593 [Halteria grandinella]
MQRKCLFCNTWEEISLKPLLQDQLCTIKFLHILHRFCFGHLQVYTQDLLRKSALLELVSYPSQSFDKSQPCKCAQSTLHSLCPQLS